MFFALSAHADNLLVIGDSHSCGAFGYRLFSNLVQRGHSVTVYCMESSAPKHWINGERPGSKICQEMNQTRFTPCDGTGEPPNLGTLLDRHPGAKVIIALGTNSLSGTSAGVYYEEMVSTIRESGRACDWIGPPNLQPAGRKKAIQTMQSNLPAFYTSLHDVTVPTCNLIDSRGATAPGTEGNATSDGIHRTAAAGTYWADLITTQLSLSDVSTPEQDPDFFFAPATK